jgi:hypothetical protein
MRSVCSVYTTTVLRGKVCTICKSLLLLLLLFPGTAVAQAVYSVWLRTGRSGFDPRQRQRIFPLAPASRPALGPTQPPIQRVPGVKRGRGVTLTTHPHLVPGLNMSRSYTFSPPPCASMACSGITLTSTIIYIIKLKLMKFSLLHYSKLVLELSRPAVRWVQGKKRPNCEPDLVPRLRMHGAMSLLRHTAPDAVCRDNFTFAFTSS